MVEQLPTKEEFSAQVNSVFRARDDGQSGFDLYLESLNEGVSNSVQETFSLLFRGPADAPPDQGIYRLEHETCGPMDIFLVPIRKDEAGLYYEAVFNRLLEANGQ